MKKQKINYAIIGCVLLYSFAAISCVNDIDTDPRNLIGRWQMVKVIDQGKTILKPDPPKWYSEVEMEFLENGKIEGTLPTDTFLGEYEINGEDSIKIQGRSLSKVGIPEWGDLFYDSYLLINTFALKRKGLSSRYNELHLNYDTGELIFDRIK